MSEMNREEQQAMAIRLAAALEQYDRTCAEMVRSWLDMELYAAVSALVEEMRPCCDWLPRLAVPWAAFLMAHCDLVFSLYQAGSGRSCCPDVQACARHHSVALGHLRQSCARLCG